MKSARTRRHHLLRWATGSFLAAIAAAVVLLGTQIEGLRLYAAAGVSLSILVSAWSYRKTQDVFHPLAFFTLAYMLFAVGLQLYTPIFGVPAGFEAELATRDGKYPELVAMLPLGVVGLWLGVNLADRLADSPSFRHFDAFALRVTRVNFGLSSLALIGMIAGTVVLWYQLLQRGGVTALFEQYGQDQYTYDSYYYFSLLAQFVWIPSFLLFAAESFRGPRAIKTAVLSALPFLVPLTIHGIRFLLLIATLGIVLAWHVRRRRITLVQILIVLIPLLTGLSTLGQFRGSRSTESLQVSLGGLLQESLGPGAGAGAVTAVITDLVPLVIPYQHGGTYISSILNLVPGFLFGSAGRPFFNPSLAFHDAYSPGLSDHGFGFSMTAEAYMNWGVWGALPALLFVGLILGFSYNYLKVRRDSYSIAVYSIVVFESLWYLRADSTAYVKAVLFPIIILKLISLFAGSRYPRLLQGKPRPSLVNTTEKP